MLKSSGNNVYTAVMQIHQCSATTRNARVNQAYTAVMLVCIAFIASIVSFSCKDIWCVLMYGRCDGRAAECCFRFRRASRALTRRAHRLRHHVITVIDVARVVSTRRKCRCAHPAESHENVAGHSRRRAAGVDAQTQAGEFQTDFRF